MEYSNMLQSIDELIIQGTSSSPRKMDKHDLCDDNKPSFKQSVGRVCITWDMEASNCFIMPHVHNLKGGSFRLESAQPAPGHFPFSFNVARVSCTVHQWFDCLKRVHFSSNFHVTGHLTAFQLQTFRRVHLHLKI